MRPWGEEYEFPSMGELFKVVELDCVQSHHGCREEASQWPGGDNGKDV